MLHMRLPDFAEKDLQRQYDKGWKPTEIFGGRNVAVAWNTTKARVYPPKLCKVLGQAYLDFWSRCKTSGKTVQT